MNTSQLKATLNFGEKLIQVEGHLKVCQNGVVISSYIISPDGELWLEVMNIPSNPPSGHFKVVNLYVDKDSGKLVVDYDNTPTP